MADPAFMQLALEEAALGLGKTAPNPPVGAVVVKDGKVVGRGHHKKAGGPHAEVHALRAAGSSARGATLYVTLEPCSTTGRTPPCVEAILQAGISKVVIGCLDPNPRHAGAALVWLEREGVAVETPLLEEECQFLIRAFRHLQKTGQPYVSLKLAVTMDGRIADKKGKSRWITGPASRKKVQELRRGCDAILVGTETIRLDDPSLLPRPARGRKPLRIIPDRMGRLPLNRIVFNDGKASQTLVLVGASFPEARVQRMTRLGVAGVKVRETKRGIHWPSALKTLAGRGVQHILCEGGGQLAGSLIRAGLVQELHLVVAPKMLGDRGRPAVVAPWTMENAPEWELIEAERFGQDLWMTYKPKS